MKLSVSVFQCGRTIYVAEYTKCIILCFMNEILEEIYSVTKYVHGNFKVYLYLFIYIFTNAVPKST